MTRTSLDQTLGRLYWIVGVIIAVAVISKLSAQAPGVAETTAGRWLGGVYELIRDMSLLIATAGVAHITNVFQKRSKFVESLEEEWRGIVRTKSELFTFCEREGTTTDDYLAAFRAISETIDSMRIVYRNAGETAELIGLYPYAPLHDMRRALQSIDPRRYTGITPEYRALVRDAILQSFYALRENFLEELDLEMPRHPLLIYGGRRLKRPGEEDWASREQERQRQRQLAAPADSERGRHVDELLARLYEQEKTAEKARRQHAA